MKVSPTGSVLISSYPRSGNHMLRAVLEYATRRPTLGCPETNNDPPIFEREPNRNEKLISIESDLPVGLKMHSLRDFALWERQGPEFVRQMLLITRDPVEAISSHLLRAFRKKWFVSDKSLRRAVAGELSFYLESVVLFRSYDDQNRFRVSFEKLKGPDNTRYVNEILREIGIDASLSEEELRRVLRLSKDSQKSLKPVQQNLQNKVKKEVARMVSSEQIERLLGN